MPDDSIIIRKQWNEKIEDTWNYRYNNYCFKFYIIDNYNRHNSVWSWRCECQTYCSFCKPEIFVNFSNLFLRRATNFFFQGIKDLLTFSKVCCKWNGTTILRAELKGLQVVYAILEKSKRSNRIWWDISARKHRLLQH